MWRVNWFVDYLAKSAAKPSRVPESVTQFVANSAKLVQHQAARLGTVTHPENNHKVTVNLDDGTTETRAMRDSTDQRSNWRTRGGNKQKSKAAPSDMMTSRDSYAFAAVERINQAPSGMRDTYRKAGRKRFATHANGRAQSRSTIVQVEPLKDRLAEERHLASWLTTRQLRPSTLPATVDRLEDIKARVRAKRFRATEDEDEGGKRSRRR